MPRPAALLLALVTGCSPAVVAPRPADIPPPPRPELDTAHDPAQCGTVRGRVSWSGPVPAVPEYLGSVPGPAGYAWGNWPHPFAPRVDAGTRGIAGALVWIAGVDPARSRPWDLPPVTVEIRGHRFTTPDGQPFGAGVSRTGDEVSFVSRDTTLHAARARGTAFFTLPLPKPDSPLSRPLPVPGVVELTSGAGYYWMAADVLVSDTPYAAVTAADGSFALPRVPAGSYALHLRVRSWHLARAERDPETGLVFRHGYAAPLTRSTPVTVTAGGTVEQAFTVTATDFPGTN